MMAHDNRMADWAATGRRVSDRRKELRLWMKDVYRKLGIGPKAYREIEGGKRRLEDDIANELADILRVDARWLTKGWSRIACDVVDGVVDGLRKHDLIPPMQATSVVAFRKAG